MGRHPLDDALECIDAILIESPSPDGRWTLTMLAQFAGLDPRDVRELVEYGALHPDNPDVVEHEQWMFGPHCAVVVRTAVRLRRDFDLDPAGLALALTLIERIRGLEDELRRANALLPHR